MPRLATKQGCKGNAGTLRKSSEQARIKAYAEYDKYRIVQDREFLSDFDKEVLRLKGEMGLQEDKE